MRCDHLLDSAIPYSVSHKGLFPTILDVHPVNIQGILRLLHVRWCMVKDEYTLSSWILPFKDGYGLVNLCEEQIVLK